MVAQLVILGVFLLFVLVAGLFILIFKLATDMKAIAEQAILSSKAVSARDLAEAKEYSADAALSREFTREATGPAIATVDPAQPTYKDPVTGHELKVLRPFL